MTAINVSNTASLHPRSSPPLDLSLGVLFLTTIVLSSLLLVASFARLTWSSPSSAEIFLMGVAIFTGCRWITLLCLGYRAVCRDEGSIAEKDSALPYVTISVPSYNEEQTIEAALDSLLELDYPNYEVIVVNDGSSDRTLSIATRYEGQHGGCRIRVIDKQNGGKWSAHNTAFRLSRGELILCIDADSQLDPPALKRMVRRIIHCDVAGVAGQMRVRNRENLLTRLQGLEYLMANGAVRLAQGLSGSVLLVPGPIGLFRRTAMEEVYRVYGSGVEETPSTPSGPFEGDTFAEDFDLSLAIHCLGGRILYEPSAISRTKAPDRHESLLNQRYRWIRGTIQVLKKLWMRTQASSSARSPRLLGWALCTYLPDLILLPMLYVIGLIFLSTQLYAGGQLLPIAAWSVGLLGVQASAGVTFITIHKDDFSLLKVLPLFGLYSGLVLNGAWWISVLDEIRGSRMRW